MVSEVGEVTSQNALRGAKQGLWLVWVSIFVLMPSLCTFGNRHSIPESVLLQGGMVIDGSGSKRRRADVRVQGDTILAVGKLKPIEGERVLSAKGLVVAPGFIDTHSHCDGRLLSLPNAEAHIRQGITTAVVGVDGGSNLPLKDWFAKVEQAKVALNIASYVGHGTVRQSVMGQDTRRPASPTEVSRMEQLVQQEMEAGAIGISTGLEYDPGYYATTEEIIACAKVAAKYGGSYTSHLRDEGNKVFEAIEELIRIAKEAKIPAKVCHLKLGTAAVWGKTKEVHKLFNKANQSGLDIRADIYPYTYWQSTIVVLIPTRDWNDRSAWEKGLAEVGGASRVRLSAYSPNPQWQGKTLEEIAKASGKDAVTVIQEILAQTHNVDGSRKEGVRESVIVEAMNERDVQVLIAAPETNICSDGGLDGGHPRGAGAFPRVLARYVRDTKTLTLEKAVYKMTHLPAKRLGFADRGLLRPGYKADIVLFDPQAVRDMASVAQSTTPPEGIPTVLVNGKITLLDGKIYAERAGKVLRRR